MRLTGLERHDDTLTLVRCKNEADFARLRSAGRNLRLEYSLITDHTDRKSAYEAASMEPPRILIQKVQQTVDLHFGFVLVADISARPNSVLFGPFLTSPLQRRSCICEVKCFGKSLRPKVLVKVEAQRHLNCLQPHGRCFSSSGPSFSVSK